MKSDRPKQQTPADMVSRLLAVVRGQFCADMTGAEWGKHSHFVRRNVILWPAHFICNVRHFTIPPEKYERVMREIFEGIKRHGNTDLVKYWPGYLMKCVQDHWKHHWEEYYQESKSVTLMAETALVNLGKVPDAPDRGVEALAMVHSVLTKKARQKQTTAPSEPTFPGF